MKKLLLLSLFAFFIFACNETSSTKKATTHSFDKVDGDITNTLQYTLKNGLKVYLSINPETPQVNVNIAIKSGSKQDPSDATGLAHYLEHMLFKGTRNIGSLNWDKEKILLKQIADLYEKRRSVTDETIRKAIYHQIDSISLLASKYVVPNEYDNLVSGIGAKGVNAYTSNDKTVYHSTIPSNELDKYLQIERERFGELVLRLFHTELEAVYEEYNQGLDQDGRRSYYELVKQLFKKHPYGQQSTIGKGEHLKNPSLYKIHEYFNTYYVPNNMAIIISGDLDPDKTIDIIEKHFGNLPSKEVPQFTPINEDTLAKNEEYTIIGKEEPWVYVGFRFPGAVDAEAAKLLPILDGIFNNGKSGMLDLDLVQSQKVLKAGSGYNIMKDYSFFMLKGYPKSGQSLDEVRALLLEEVSQFLDGNFSPSLIKAYGKNKELNFQNQIESNKGRSSHLVNSYILDTPWDTYLKNIQNIHTVSKETLLNFAKKHIDSNKHVTIYKKTGVPEIEKVEKPKISPLPITRDTSSVYAQKFTKIQTPQIQPKFRDYKKELHQSKINKSDFYYVENPLNKTFSLSYIFPFGTLNYPKLPIALNYIELLDTEKNTAKELQTKLFEKGLSYSSSISRDQTVITVSGLESSFDDAASFLEKRITTNIPNNEILKQLITNTLQERENAKLDTRTIERHIMSYIKYGNDKFRTLVSDKEITLLNPEELTETVKNLFQQKHDVYFYGTIPKETVKSSIEKSHTFPKEFQPTLKVAPNKEKILTKNTSYFIHQPSVQANFNSLSLLTQYRSDKMGYVSMYNNYYGSGLSSIVFQELREAKALAYNAVSYILTPQNSYDNFYAYTHIGTQADKLIEASSTLDSLNHNVPIIEEKFNQEKAAKLKSITSSPITNRYLFWNYLSDKRKGNTKTQRQLLYEQAKTLTPNDFQKFLNTIVYNKPTHYFTIANRNLIKTELLKEFGELKELTLEEIFGY